MLGITILILLFTISITVWNTSMTRAREIEEIQDLESTAITLSDLLVKTGGLPENWEEGMPREYTSDRNTIGLWHLNEGDGNYANDNSTTNPTPGDLEPGPQTGPLWEFGRSCKFRNCLKFDGNNDWVKIDEIPAYNTVNYTIELWYYMISGSTPSNPDQKIVYKEGQFYIKLVSSNDISFLVAGVGEFRTLQPPSGLRRWTHIALSVRNFPAQFQTEVRFYVDGRLTAISGPGGPACTIGLALNCSGTPLTASNNIALGSQDGSQNFFNGRLDEFRFSNTARTAFKTGDIYAPGLANDSYILDPNKLAEFTRLNYLEIKNTLVSNSEFYFRLVGRDGYTSRTNGVIKEPVALVGDRDDEIEVAKLLNGSGVIWDLYWEGTSLPPQIIRNDARNVYINAIEDRVFRWMIGNLSSYNTVISEDSHVRDTSLSSSEQETLRNWVHSGKTFVQIQHHEEILRVFGLTESGGDGSGTVVATDEILPYAATGTAITFQEGTETFIIPSPLPLKVIMEVTGNSARCIFCKWTYGNGSLYYFPDMNVTSPNRHIPGLDITGSPTEIGQRPLTLPSTAINARRAVILNGSILHIDLVTWR